jgi:hypothetical protein
VGADFLLNLAGFAPSTLHAMVARASLRQIAFNLIVTNVPGPQFPLYVLGRKMESIFPMVPLARRQALCVGIMSYNGQVNFGLVGDYDAMADIESFGLDLEAAVAEVVATTPKRRSRAKATAPASTNGASAVAAEPSSN